jgi:hypothetical protein
MKIARLILISHYNLKLPVFTLFLIFTNFALLKYPRFPFLLIAVLTNQSIYKIEQPNNLLSFGSMPTIVINEYFPNGATSYQNSQRTKEDNRSVGSQGEPKTTRNHQAQHLHQKL